MTEPTPDRQEVLARLKPVQRMARRLLPVLRYVVGQSQAPLDWDEVSQGLGWLVTALERHPEARVATTGSLVLVLDPSGNRDRYDVLVRVGSIGSEEIAAAEHFAAQRVERRQASHPNPTDMPRRP